MKKINKPNSLAVIIPMYNEERVAKACIDQVMRELKKLKFPYALIVVNDGSTDKTGVILEKKQKEYKKNYIVITHKKNLGFGAGNTSGINMALKLGYVWCLHMDAGLTNDPKHIKVFAGFMNTDYDCIKASRYIKGSRVLGVPKYRRIISIIGNNLVSPLFGIGIKDCTNGFRMVRLSKIKGVKFREKNYSMILEELYYLKIRTSKFKEIPYVLKMDKKTVSHFNYKPKSFIDYFKYALKSSFI